MWAIAGGIIIAFFVLKYWEELAALAVVGAVLLVDLVIGISVFAYVADSAEERRTARAARAEVARAQVAPQVHRAPPSNSAKPWSQETQDAVDAAKAEREQREAEVARVATAIPRQVPPDFRRYVSEAATKYSLPEELLYAVIFVESGFDDRATSSRGEAGLMKLTPEVAKAMGVTDVWNPQQNIFGGARYLRTLANQSQGDLVKTLKAYNSGPLRQANGVSSEHSTDEYVERVLMLYERLKAAKKG